MSHRSWIPLLSSFTCALALSACDASNTSDDAATATSDAAVEISDAASATDVPTEMGPFVCQAHAYTCPTRSALDACEMGFGDAVCMRLPLIDCEGPGAPDPGSCPSADQICRLESGSMGFCTHSCSDDEDCPLPEGGTGTCGAGNSCLR